jgi:hypothetical protein
MTAAPEGGEQKSLGTVLYTSAGVVLLTVIGVIAFPYVYEPVKPARGSVEYGDYLVEPTLSSACGPGAHRIFYKRRLVTKVSGVTAFSPRNPARLLYNAACAKNGSESGAFYFSGALAAPVQVNPLGMDEPGDWFNLYWSPDDKFVIVPAYGHATLVNLKTGQSLGFLSDLLGSKEAFSSNSQFREWSPDGKKMAAVVLSTCARNDRSLYSESELMEIDPATLTKRYVATISKPDGWGVGEYGWVGKDGSYDLVVDSSVENDSRVYRKR